MAIHFDTQGPAPDGFHVPTTNEWQWVKTIMDWLSLTTWNNWRINLHIPLAGFRVRSSNVTYQGSNAYLWSSSSISGSDYAFGVYFNNSSSVYAGYTNGTRIQGLPVRCFKDSYVAPDSNWTIVQWTLGSAWIFWNQSEWLISITDWTTGYTMMDKNLWATTVYNDWDTLTQANMGNMYQWWNNYWFPSTGTISKTSSTQVDASNYWPWNYYESDTFITWYNDWSSVYNNNLRWWVSQWTWSDPMRLHWAIQTFHRAPKPPTSITLNESAIIFSAVWDTQQLTATVSPGDAAKDFIWASNDTSIATVSNTWLVTCVSLWNCVITCTAKYWSATASCSVINPENVTMTNTSYSLDATYTSLTTTLFTASKTWYYHITWTFWARSQAGGATWATHSLSWWEYKSWTNSWWTDPGRSIAVDCVYYIEAWTEFKWYVETYWYTSWWWSNFAAVYYWSYDPTPDLYPDA